MLNQYCAHSFVRNWQLLFLNQWMGENDHRKYFMSYQWMLQYQWGLNSQPPAHLSDAHSAELPRPAEWMGINDFFQWVTKLLLILTVKCIPQRQLFPWCHIWFITWEIGTYVLCEQLRSRSICISMQSDLGILCSLTYTTVFTDSVSRQQRPRSACTNVQADLSLCCLQTA